MSKTLEDQLAEAREMLAHYQEENRKLKAQLQSGPPAQQTHATEFPEVEIPPQVLALLETDGLVDESWGNDAAPSFSVGNNDRYLRIWVDHHDRDKRQMSVGGPRFFLIDSDDEVILEGNDIDAIIAAMRAEMVKRFPGYDFTCWDKAQVEGKKT